MASLSPSAPVNSPSAPAGPSCITSARCQAVIAARQSGLLITGGGHPAAAGLTVEAARIDDLRSFLAERLGPSVADHGATPSLGLDGALTVGSRITFLNMGAYTMSKAHRFNGVGLPTIYARRPDGSLDRVGTDSFDEFAQYAGGTDIAVA